ncbi:MAG: urea ABC transporter permease subunit UrtB [Zoogloeaceae bacterium]|jgi:urea transport system permease protein|nr:urea ABC transporter permease subunit UrtB [Zoogloeaceae bacterium]
MLRSSFSLFSLPTFVFRLAVVWLLFCFSLGAEARPDAGQLTALAAGDNDAKIAALQQLAAQAETDALPVLEALQDDALYLFGQSVLIARADGGAVDALTDEVLAELPADAENITINNRVRGALAVTLAAIRLASNHASTRLEAIEALRANPDAALLPLLDRAWAKEENASIRKRIEITRAMMRLQDTDRAVRLEAIQTLGQTSDPANRQLLEPLLAKDAAGMDPELRAAAQKAVTQINNRLARGEILGGIFSGLSLGSILLLAALGLAVIYGLMGVINMAHGELIMIGAYATYVTQTLVRGHAPGWFDWYPLLALPVSFLAAALVGIAMERLVIRHLYGRPLETLLATWGISLILIQTVRTFFGAQNVAVENPAWLSGGIEIYSNLILPYNRIAIIVFAAAVVLAVALLLARSRMGLFVRAVTQNRPMARCMGVPTGRVDALTFGLGAGIAGLAGSALSQIGNVGPELGQGYIVDSFMVVVLGGVGQIAGAVYAALGLGVLSKFIEGFAGAVLAKIAILLMIIAFIQKRPQGIFALKGRFAEQ